VSYQQHKSQSPRNVAYAVLIISDTRTEADDETGKLLKERLGESGHHLVAYAIVKNEAGAVKDKLRELLPRNELQVIITSGGTGVSSRDVTVEALSPILEKTLPGFGELFRYLTYQELGTASIMTRAIAGVAVGKVIICLPGSLAAVKLALEKMILPEIGHMVREATR